MKICCLTLVGALFCAVALMLNAAAQDADDHGEQWGARGISLRKTASGATIEFGCAHGNITQRIRPNAAGEFSVTGTYTPEMGGPVRKDNPSRDLPATYKGTISGDTMHLEVLLADKSQQPQPFTLTRGSFSKLVKCR